MLAARDPSGIDCFDEQLDTAVGNHMSIGGSGLDEVGGYAALVSGAASSITGNINYVDAGYHIVG